MSENRYHKTCLDTQPPDDNIEDHNTCLNTTPNNDNNKDHKTCLNTAPHHDNIEDHLLHFLGCIEFHERHAFLNSDEHVVWAGEREYLKGKYPSASDAEARTQAEKQRERWKEDCESELRRIDFLRSCLTEDKDEKHLVRCIRESRNGWVNSKEYKEGINLVKKWDNRTPGRDNDIKLEYEKGEKGEKEDQQRVPKYDLERDINVPIIQFQNGEPRNFKVVDGGGVWGSFPDQKINIGRLLDAKEENHLYRDKGRDLDDAGSEQHGDRLSTEVKYFHIPSNNMAWAEKAVARYFDQEPPDFHALRREIHRVDHNETSLILRDSHWRGQLHGDPATVNSRSMRPFCDAISSDPDKVDHVPKNVVLFMPYMHWETSRNRELFAGNIEKLVHDKANVKLKKSMMSAKAERQSFRSGMERIVFQQAAAEHEPTWPQVSKIWKNLTGKACNGNEDEPKESAKTLQDPVWQVRQKKACLSTPFRMDSNRRLEIVRKEDDGTDVKAGQGSRLGQYLIDAARLFEGMVNYRDKQLMERFLLGDSPSALHPRRTLDQAYHLTLKSTRSRDSDQVVYRATTANPTKFHRFNQKTQKWEDHEHPGHLETDTAAEVCQDCTDKIKKVSRVVMVDQLWMWILDAKTIITCFPKRYGVNKNDSSGVHKSIRTRIAEGRRQQVKSVFDLALIILEECSNTFFDQSRTSDRQPQVLDAFSEAIGNVMHKQTTSFEKLWRYTKDAQKMYRHGSRSHILESNLGKIYIPLLDITPEGKLENEIKDILEEIGIMIYIKKTNRDILKQFIGHVVHILDPHGEFGKGHARNCTAKNLVARRKTGPPVDPKVPDEDQQDSYDWFKVNSDETLDRFNDRIEQLEELERSAVKVAASVKDLLELKQQQAGVLQAWLSVKQSDEAIKQSRSVMIFTIVTIIFLPLSFMSSIFGMNSIEFGGDGNTMHLRAQFVYMLGISAGVIVLTLAFSLSDWLRAFVWSWYAKATLSFCTWSGLYRWRFDKKISSRAIYEQTVDTIAGWKEKALEEPSAEKTTVNGRRGAPGRPNANGVNGAHETDRSRWKSWRRVGNASMA